MDQNRNKNKNRKLRCIMIKIKKYFELVLVNNLRTLSPFNLYP